MTTFASFRPLPYPVNPAEGPDIPVNGLVPTLIKMVIGCLVKMSNFGELHKKVVVALSNPHVVGNFKPNFRKAIGEPKILDNGAQERTVEYVAIGCVLTMVVRFIKTEFPNGTSKIVTELRVATIAKTTGGEERRIVCLGRGKGGGKGSPITIYAPEVTPLVAGQEAKVPVCPNCGSTRCCATNPPKAALTEIVAETRTPEPVPAVVEVPVTPAVEVPAAVEVPVTPAAAKPKRKRKGKAPVAPVAPEAPKA